MVCVDTHNRAFRARFYFFLRFYLHKQRWLHRRLLVLRAYIVLGPFRKYDVSTLFRTKNLIGF
jgi:hypothetical protein